MPVIHDARVLSQIGIFLIQRCVPLCDAVSIGIKQLVNFADRGHANNGVTLFNGVNNSLVFVRIYLAKHSMRVVQVRLRAVRYEELTAISPRSCVRHG